MKSTLKFAVAAAAAMILAGSGTAHALSFTFSDKDYQGGASWGTLDITATAVNTLELKYTAQTAPIIPDGSRVTGFAFTFVPDTTVPQGVGNPDNSYSAGDRDELNWVMINNQQPNTYPNPSNGDEFIPAVEKFSYFFDVGNDPNREGIFNGEMDIFSLTFASGVPDLTDPTKLANFVALTGIRLQSLPNTINEGSLFLVGKTPNEPVPEPGTLLLFGSGILGLGLMRRRKNRS